MPPKDKMKNTKTGSKVHVRMQVMLSRAFQNGHFPLAQRKLLLLGQYRRKCSSQNDGFRCILGMETLACTRCLLKSSFEKHNFMKNEKIKEKSCQEASKIGDYIAMANMKSKSWMQSGCELGRKVTRKALCTPNNQFCDIFKVPLEAHETKEKETKEQVSDASQKK